MWKFTLSFASGDLLPPKPASYEINMRAGGKSIMKPQRQSTWRALIDSEEMEEERKEKGEKEEWPEEET